MYTTYFLAEHSRLVSANVMYFLEPLKRPIMRLVQLCTCWIGFAVIFVYARMEPADAKQFVLAARAQSFVNRLHATLLLGFLSNVGRVWIAKWMAWRVRNHTFRSQMQAVLFKEFVLSTLATPRNPTDRDFSLTVMTSWHVPLLKLLSSSSRHTRMGSIEHMRLLEKHVRR